MRPTSREKVRTHFLFHSEADQTDLRSVSSDQTDGQAADQTDLRSVSSDQTDGHAADQTDLRSVSSERPLLVRLQQLQLRNSLQR